MEEPGANHVVGTEKRICVVRSSDQTYYGCFLVHWYTYRSPLDLTEIHDKHYSILNHETYSRIGNEQIRGGDLNGS